MPDHHQKLPEFASICYWAGVSLLLLSPLVISSATVFPYSVSKLAVVQLGTALCLLALTLRSNANVRWTFLHSLGLAYLSIVVMTALTGADPTRSLFSGFERSQGVITLAGWLVLAYCLAGYLRSSTDWRRLLLLTCCSGYLVSLLALLHYAGVLSVDNLYQDGERLSYTTGNATLLGAYLACQLPLASMFLFTAIRDRGYAPVTILHGVGLICLLIALVATGSRGALLAAVIWGAVMLMQLPAAARLPLIGIAALIGTVAIGLNWSLLSDRIAATTLDGTSVSGRMGAAMIGLRAVMAAPLAGWGADNYLLAFGQLARPGEAGSDAYDHAHSHLIDIAVTSGIPGLLCYLALAVSAIWILFRARGEASSDDGDLLLAVGGVMISYQVTALFLFEALVNQLLFYIALGYCLWLAASRFSFRTVPSGVSRTIAGLFVVSLTGVGTSIWNDARHAQNLTTPQWRNSLTSLPGLWRHEEKLVLLSKNIWRDWRSMGSDDKAAARAALIVLGGRRINEQNWRSLGYLGFAWLRIAADYPEDAALLPEIAVQLQAIAPGRWEVAEFLAYYYLAQRQTGNALNALSSYLSKDPGKPRLLALKQRIEGP